MDKKEEKELEYLNAQLNRLWTGIIVLGGGIAGLVITYSYALPLYVSENITKLILFIIGFVIFTMMLIGLANINIEINKFLKKG